MKLSVGLILLVLCFACNKSLSETPQAENPQPISDSRAFEINKMKNSIEPFFQQMTVRDGDWLKSFPENGQTFEEYLTINPTLPTAEKNKIYIQPVGNFTETQRKILSLTAEYMRAFYGLPIVLNAEKKLENLPKAMIRKNKYERHTQIKTEYFLNEILLKNIPQNAAAFIAFTDADLFPDENMNYVFGQANLQSRVGVWSLWRLGNPDQSLEDYKLFLARTLKIVMHETGHMFSMYHCTKYECLMSGSNGLHETDRRPLDVCPECMAKISWAMNYAPEKRYENLVAFWRKQGWSEEEKLSLEKKNSFSSILK